ncbi:unnamed protein product [Prunus armeniaca]|uniref:Uncharacterized protein n=1 Tax=Prunus armeniaca TaxID=36596 RepID=A0A6J5X1P5_PRUAR|nr:unnamed protein product [Prunus armeniaca]
MEYDSLSRCLGGEVVDTRDLKSCAKERGGSSPLQGIILNIVTHPIIAMRNDIEVSLNTHPINLIVNCRVIIEQHDSSTHLPSLRSFPSQDKATRSCLYWVGA